MKISSFEPQVCSIQVIAGWQLTNKKNNHQLLKFLHSVLITSIK